MHQDAPLPAEYFHIVSENNANPCGTEKTGTK